MAKKKGVKPGAKRGPYKKTLQKQAGENFNDAPAEIKSEEINNIEAAADKLEAQFNNEAMAEQPEIKTEDTIKETEAASIEESTAETKTEAAIEHKSTPDPEPEIKSEPSPVQDVQADVFKEKTGEDEFNDWMKDYEEAEPEDIKKIETAAIERQEKQIKKKEEEDDRVIRDAGAELFNGAMLIGLCDFIFPGALKLVYKYLLKNEKAAHVKTTDVMLTQDQLDSISPASDAAAKYVFQRVHPLLIFGISMFVAYSVNFKIALEKVELPKIEEKKGDKKEDKKEDEKK